MKKIQHFMFSMPKGRLVLMVLVLLAILLSGCGGNDKQLQTGWIVVPQGAQVYYTDKVTVAGNLPASLCSYAQKDGDWIGLVNVSLQAVDSFIKAFETTWFENQAVCETSLVPGVNLQPQQEVGSINAQDIQIVVPDQQQQQQQAQNPPVQAQAIPLPQPGYQTMKERIATITNFKPFDQLMHVIFGIILIIAAPLENAAEKKRSLTTKVYIVAIVIVVLVGLSRGAYKDGTLVPLCNTMGSGIERACDTVAPFLGITQFFTLILAFGAVALTSNSQRDIEGTMQHEERFATAELRQQWIDNEMAKKGYDHPVPGYSDGNKEKPYFVTVDKMKEVARVDRTYVLGLTAVVLGVADFTGVMLIGLGQTGLDHWNWGVGLGYVLLWILSLGEVRKEHGGSGTSLAAVLILDVLVVAAFMAFLDKVLPFATTLAIIAFPIVNARFKGKGDLATGTIDLMFFNIVTWILLNHGLIQIVTRIIEQATGS